MIKKLTILGLGLGIFTISACQDDDFSPEQEALQQRISSESLDSIHVQSGDTTINGGDDRTQVPVKIVETTNEDGGDDRTQVPVKIVETTNEDGGDDRTQVPVKINKSTQEVEEEGGDDRTQVPIKK